MAKEYPYAVWGTQGGGLAQRFGNDAYVFVEKPDCPGFNVGDLVPDEWDLIPANKLAREEKENEDAEKDDYDPLHWPPGDTGERFDL